MGFWIILYIIDGLFFMAAAGTVLYMLVYAVASLFNHHSELPKPNRQNRFIIHCFQVINNQQRTLPG